MLLGSDPQYSQDIKIRPWDIDDDMNILDDENGTLDKGSEWGKI